MGCRSSTPLDVVIEAGRRREEYLRTTAGERASPSSMEVLTLANLAAFEDRRRFANRRRHRNHEESVADLVALQQSLSMMETFFETLIGNTAGFYMEAMDPNNNAQGPPPANDAAIASLIRFPLTVNELSMLHDKICTVCCEVLKVKDLVSRLPCGHIFCRDCVEPWLARHCTCPSCRYELPTDDDEYEEGRLERMKSRKLPECRHDDDASSHSSESGPDITWDETSTTSWGEEGVHLMDGFQHWYGYEDFQDQEDEEGELCFGRGERSSRNERPWMIRLIDDDVEDRPASTLPAAMERLNSVHVREEGPGGEQRRAVEEEPTPRTSNATTKSRTHFSGQDDKHEMIEAGEEDECTMPVNEVKTFAPVQEVNVE